MSEGRHGRDLRVAVLADRDETHLDSLEHVLHMVAQFGRVVLRRGYGQPDTLAGWRDALGRLACTPCGRPPGSAFKPPPAS